MECRKGAEKYGESRLKETISICQMSASVCVFTDPTGGLVHNQPFPEHTRKLKGGHRGKRGGKVGKYLVKEAIRKVA